jgi:hypothetical protein
MLFSLTRQDIQDSLAERVPGFFYNKRPTVHNTQNVASSNDKNNNSELS